MSVMCVDVPRESVEFLPMPITVNGTGTTDFDTAITATGVRPSSWTAATVLGTEAGVMVQNLSPGTYKVWAKVTAGVEEIVVHVGNLVIT